MTGTGAEAVHLRYQTCFKISKTLENIKKPFDAPFQFVSSAANVSILM